MLLHQDVEPLLFLNMFEERSTEAIATDLFPSIKFETALQLGIQAPEVKQGESAEMHKEPGDKDAIRKLLLTLSGDELGRRLVYGEEVMFVPPTSDRGLRGKIDLVIGTTNENSGAELTINHNKEAVAYLSDTKFSETKQDGKPLATAKARADKTCILTDAQPVLVVLSVSQVQNSQEPCLLFYGSRSHIRPFLYFRSLDILLSTSHEFLWKDNDIIDIGGVCVVAMLLRAERALKYHPSEFFACFFDMCKYPKTGFMNAMTQSSIDLSQATLCTTAMAVPPNRKRPLDPAIEDDSIVQSQRKRVMDRLNSGDY